MDAYQTSDYLYSHEYICEYRWPYSLSIFGLDSDLDCMDVWSGADYNYDGYTNFREYTAVAVNLTENGDAEGLWLNCSSCVGMEYYNIKYESE